MQKAIQDNHGSKRHKRTNLLRKQSEEESKETLAGLAAEAAATAAARTDQIRQETKKISERKSDQQEAATLEAQQEPRGEVISSPEEEVYDIREKGVHRMNLKERLPWLKDREPIKEEVTENQQPGVDDDNRDVLSPDSGVDQLSDVEDLGETPKHEHSQSHKIVEQSPVHHTQTTSTDEIPVHLQNGGLDMLPALPPRDYPKQLPPKDYPKMTDSEGQPHTAGTAYQNDLLADNDYYSLMMGGIVN